MYRPAVARMRLLLISHSSSSLPPAASRHSPTVPRQPVFSIHPIPSCWWRWRWSSSPPPPTAEEIKLKKKMTTAQIAGRPMHFDIVVWCCDLSLPMSYVWWWRWRWRWLFLAWKREEEKGRLRSTPLSLSLPSCLFFFKGMTFVSRFFFILLLAHINQTWRYTWILSCLGNSYF